jgi:nucleotide-binding universal stress UspA family protein
MLNATKNYQFSSRGLAAWSHTAGELATFNQITFKNILFATDFSRATNAALPYAVEIARRFGANVHVVNVVQPDFYPYVPPSEWARIAHEEEEFRRKGKLKLEEEFQGLAHEFIFPSGDVWVNLSRIIEEKNIDLIVLGTHGRTGIEKILMGSTAEMVFRRAECPVLTVGCGVFSKATHAAAADLNRILFATDFSPESLAAVPYAISLAKEHRAELILMHAIQKSEPGEVNSAFQTLRDVIPFGTWLALEPRYVVEQGAPEAAILDVATKQNADLIVMGLRAGKGFLPVTTHLVNSIAYSVVTQATCPVLTVRT